MAKKNKKSIDWRIVCMGLACLTALELGAMYLGFNGRILSLVLIVIAAAIGVTIPSPNIKH